LLSNHTLPEGCGTLGVSFRSRASGITDYGWDFGDGSRVVNTPNPVHTYRQPGTYTVRLTTTEPLCLGSNEAVQRITVHPAPPPDFAAWSSIPAANGPALVLPDTRVAFKAYGLTSTQHPVSSVLWDFGDGNSSTEANPEHTYRAAGSYTVTLTVVDAQGCAVQRAGLYRIESPELTFPNVFTPNGDGINDVWKPLFSGQQRFSYKIFDRWGIQLFEGSELHPGWNGTYGRNQLAVSGVYFYTVKHGERTYKGSLTLIRE
jgi:gliding motility-associated-like protein